MRKKRYTTKNTGHNTCTVAIRTGYYAGEVRNYWAPSEGGYVRLVTEDRPGMLGSQVIDHRLRDGVTLTWQPSEGPLAKLISHQVSQEMARLQREGYDR